MSIYKDKSFIFENTYNYQNIFDLNQKCLEFSTQKIQDPRSQDPACCSPTEPQILHCLKPITSVTAEPSSKMGH